MSNDSIFTGREVIEMIRNAPEKDYVGEYLIGRILADEPIQVAIKKVERTCERKDPEQYKDKKVLEEKE